jgi:hypothetical protein
MKCFDQKSAFILTIMNLFISVPLQATMNYCSSSTAGHFIRAKIGMLNQAQLDTDTPAQIAITTNEFNSSWVFDKKQHHTRSLGFNFRYTIVDLESINAMTNGHMHTWDFPLEGRLDNTDSNLFYNITPAISVSSNALKNPELIDSDSLQLYAGMVYKKNISDGGAWLLGFNSDHRFGSDKVYPVVGICMQLANNWDLQLALPDFNILKNFNNGLSLKLFAEPVGNQWHVFSKDTTRESNFTYNAIATGLSAQWSISRSINISLVIENQTHRQFSFVLDDNNFIELEAKPSKGMTLKGEVLF